MERYIERYVRLVIDVQLQLIEGDMLSINTEARSMGFARLLAQEATIITRLPVTIVETERGKVLQAYPIDPEVKDLFRPEEGQPVMCRIVDLDLPFTKSSGASFSEICDSAATLAEYGLLADPIFLDRRVASPWANIPYPGPYWAEAEIGHNVLEREAWEFFAKILRLDSEHCSSFWLQQANLLTWRKQRLDPLEGAELMLTGDGYSLSARLAEQTHFYSGSVTLTGGRTFIPILPIQSLAGSLAATSASGSIVASEAFWVMGTEVTGASFEVADGKAISWSATRGKEALDAFFGIDAGASQLSAIFLADANTIESQNLRVGVHPHFSTTGHSSVSFGGFLIDTLNHTVDEESLAACDLADSLVRLSVPIGSDALQVAFIVDGEEIRMIEEGVFHE